MQIKNTSVVVGSIGNNTCRMTEDLLWKPTEHFFFPGDMSKGHNQKCSFITEQIKSYCRQHTGTVIMPPSWQSTTEI